MYVHFETNNHSFVDFPRLSLHPVFNHLQYETVGGSRESLVHYLCHVNNSDVYLWIHREEEGVPNCKNEFEASSCSVFPSTEVPNVGKWKTCSGQRMVVQKRSGTLPTYLLPLHREGFPMYRKQILCIFCLKTKQWVYTSK